MCKLNLQYFLCTTYSRKYLFKFSTFFVNFWMTQSLADLGGGLRGLQPPPFRQKNLPKKGLFWPFLGLQPPFPDWMVDKSSLERLEPPFQNFLDPRMTMVAHRIHQYIYIIHTLKFSRALYSIWIWNFFFLIMNLMVKMGKADSTTRTKNSTLVDRGISQHYSQKLTSLFIVSNSSKYFKIQNWWQILKLSSTP